MDWSKGAFTHFAAAERQDRPAIRLQAEKVKESLGMGRALDMMPDMVLVLNSCRQAVFANRKLLETFHLDNDEPVLGKRPGELLECIYLKNENCGCGTTEFCRYCGAVNSILAALDFRANASECRITDQKMRTSSFMLWSSPLTVENETYVVFVVRDRQEFMVRNRVAADFLGSLLNLSSNMEAVLGFYGNEAPELTVKLSSLLEQMVADITDVKELIKLENVDFKPNSEQVSSLKLLREVCEEANRGAVNETVAAPEAENFKLFTDSRLLLKILLFLVRFLKAPESANPMVMNCLRKDREAIFTIGADYRLPEEIRKALKVDLSEPMTLRDGLKIYCSKLILATYLHGSIKLTEKQNCGFELTVSFPLENPLQAAIER